MTVSVRSAQITFKDEAAGQLMETASGGTRFVYHGNWRESIGCCLPISRHEHDWHFGLHPFFQHLGAEGWLRERQARSVHVAAEDDLGLLLRYGADCIGAVGILPLSDEGPITPAADKIAAPGRTVSGVQRKLLVYWDETAHAFRPARDTGSAPFIAKFGSDRLDHLVRNEFLSLRWLSSLLGPHEVTEFELGHVRDLNEHALIVKRFDRTEHGAKLRMEDFAQILCKPRGADFGGKYEASYEEVAAVIRDYSARPQTDLARFFRRLVAFALVANTDAHLKNFSLLERTEGLRLSPVYDVVNVGVYAADGMDQKFGLAIGGNVIQLDALTRPLFEAFGIRIGLGKNVIDRVFRDLATKARRPGKSLPQVADEGRDRFGARFTEVVRNQCLCLLEA